ncbi:major facilitator superfamily domain-containing protein [Pterulicium gracile]|uniref:Major facilitator superfamily domain-containing protein n=1 Tax=Pterulicium gracile TaxID=1884261 RepID=A0A5C3QLG6_9AGAR|nr:major facilitator superfamily domain-containing protein [Pterula gracilis]
MTGPPEEHTPLLISSDPEIGYQRDAGHAQKVASHQAVYDRFSRGEKYRIVTLVAFTGLIPLFVSGSFVPSIPQMAIDLDSTAEVISLAVSISVLATAFGTLFWATYSGFYGRRLIYLSGLPLVFIGSLGVGSSTTVSSLMCWRVVQAFGAAGGLSLGAGVIGDIYRLEERGTAMGVFFAAVLLGPALAPVAGGLAAHYSSWRVMQYALGISGLLIFLAMYTWFPETSHPGVLGVEKLPSEEREKTGRRPVVLNPLRGLALMRSPNLAAVTFATGTALLTEYVLIVPIAATIGERYGITNEAIIGACFIPMGVGNFTGAPLAGRISDRLIIKYRAQRGGTWVPEDRLRASLIGGFFLVPLSVMACGWATVFVSGWPGLVINLVGMFVNGLGVDIVLSPVGSYTVDILHNRSAEIMAANAASRNLILSACIPMMLPLIKSVGAGWTNTIAAGAAWAGAVMLHVTIRNGEAMRKWVDVGFTTNDENN